MVLTLAGDKLMGKKSSISVLGDDRASFRRFNSGSGVWSIKDTANYIDW
jgi:hypothetical protein